MKSVLVGMDVIIIIKLLLVHYNIIIINNIFEIYLIDYFEFINYAHIVFYLSVPSV